MERKPFVTWVLIGMNLAAFGAMVANGVSPTEPGRDGLLAMGANQGTLVVFDGQWWRALTSLFVHVGILHLAVNMYSLWRIGAFVENLLSGPLFALVYLLSGLGGAFASILWAPINVSAGASGAIFGLFGFIVGFAIQSRHLMPPDAAKRLWDGIVGTIAINLFLAFSIPYLDSAAHLGGAAIGLLAGFVGTMSAIEREGRGASVTSLSIVVAAVIGLGVLAKVRTDNNPIAKVAQALQDADHALNAGQYARAEELASHALAQAPNAEAFLLRALARSEAGDLDGGFRDATAAVEQLTGRGESNLELGRALTVRGNFWLAAGQFTAAENDFSRAGLMVPHPVVIAQRGYARLRIGDLDGGLVDAETVLHDPSAQPMHLNNLAWALLTRNEHLDLALKLADAAIAREPSAAARGTRCWIRVARNEAALGSPDCLAAVESANSPLDRGMVAFIQADYEEAVRVWEAAAAKNPVDASDLAPWLVKARDQIPTELLIDGD